MNTRPSITTRVGIESMMNERLNMPALLRMDGIAKNTYVSDATQKSPVRARRTMRLVDRIRTVGTRRTMQRLRYVSVMVSEADMEAWICLASWSSRVDREG